MNEYNQYVTAVNKIFDYLAKMKAGWNNLDNLNYIETIEEYKQIVAQKAEEFKKESPSAEVTNPESLEALGDD